MRWSARTTSLSTAADAFARALERDASANEVRRLGHCVLAECARVDATSTHAQAHAQIVAADVLRRLDGLETPPSVAERADGLLGDIDDVATLMALVLALVEHHDAPIARLGDAVVALERDVERSRVALERFRRAGETAPSWAARCLLAGTCVALTLIFVKT